MAETEEQTFTSKKTPEPTLAGGLGKILGLWNPWTQPLSYVFDKRIEGFKEVGSIIANAADYHVMSPISKAWGGVTGQINEDLKEAEHSRDLTQFKLQAKIQQKELEKRIDALTASTGNTNSTAEKAAETPAPTTATPEATAADPKPADADLTALATEYATARVALKKAQEPLDAIPAKEGIISGAEFVAKADASLRGEIPLTEAEKTALRDAGKEVADFRKIEEKDKTKLSAEFEAFGKAHPEGGKYAEFANQEDRAFQELYKKNSTVASTILTAVDTAHNNGETLASKAIEAIVKTSLAAPAAETPVAASPAAEKPAEPAPTAEPAASPTGAVDASNTVVKAEQAPAAGEVKKEVVTAAAEAPAELHFKGKTVAPTGLVKKGRGEQHKEDVRELKTLLTALGHKVGDGEKFDQLTYEAVLKEQMAFNESADKNKKILVDGSVGEDTAKVLLDKKVQLAAAKLNNSGTAVSSIEGEKVVAEQQTGVPNNKPVLEASASQAKA